MTQWIVRSGNDGRVSGINGSTYETRDAALAAIARYIGDDMVTVRVDGDSMCDEIVYPDQECADADADGAAPHRACATIEERPDGWSRER